VVEEEVEIMRALEICYFIICLNIAIPLVGATGIFGVGPAGVDPTALMLLVGLAVGMLTVGGISVMGWSFKAPAAISAFAGIYSASVAMVDVLIIQMIGAIPDPSALGIAVTFAVAITTICTIIGVQGAIQIAGGAFGPME
jgi:hypothetical protein